MKNKYKVEFVYEEEELSSRASYFMADNDEEAIIAVVEKWWGMSVDEYQEEQSLDTGEQALEDMIDEMSSSESYNDKEGIMVYKIVRMDNGKVIATFNGATEVEDNWMTSK